MKKIRFYTITELFDRQLTPKVNRCLHMDIWYSTFDIDWTDTSLRYPHWRMCFERLFQAFARWQPGILFDIVAQPILEYRWIDSYSQQSLRTQFKVATVYSIHTQSLSWCSTGLVPNVLPQRDEGSGMPCAVDRAS